ncbi:MAG TPA: hypothetical protein VF642_06555 [Propionibacteriaceae bacterium]
MTASASLSFGLIDDAAPLLSWSDDLSVLVADHRGHRSGRLEPCLAALVVRDQQLSELGRVEGVAGLPVLAVNTSGAGGLAALGRRSIVGVQLVAVQSAIRDLDDLAGNAARVVSAAGELPESVEVYVELPYAPGWQRAIEVVEAAGVYGTVRASAGGGGRAAAGGGHGLGSDHELVQQLHALVEADLPFAVAGWDRSLAALLLAVHGLVEEAPPDEVVSMLADPGAAVVVSQWDDSDAARVRRRLRRVQCRDLAASTADLAGLLD